VDDLAAALRDAAERQEGFDRRETRFFGEFAHGALERILARQNSSLGNRPGPVVARRPERAARVPEQHLESAAAPAEHQQARAFLLRHGSDVHTTEPPRTLPRVI
jgi:hypothetical protein